MAKDLPPAETEKLMLTHLTVSDDDLRILAQERGDECGPCATILEN